MANASNKRIAQSNARALTNLRRGMVVVNLLPLILHLLLSMLPLPNSRPLTSILSPLRPSSVFSFSTIRYLFANGLTGWIWRYFERAAGVGKGEDLAGGGVIELGWDVIYITWACVVLSTLLTSKAWWLYLAVPAIAAYKTYSFIAPFLFSRVGGPGATATPPTSEGKPNPNVRSGLKPGQKLTSARSKAAAASSGPGEGDDELDENGEPLSKRQAKLKARQERGQKSAERQERRR